MFAPTKVRGERRERRETRARVDARVTEDRVWGFRVFVREWRVGGARD
jgi:hypothetical protein